MPSRNLPLLPLLNQPLTAIVNRKDDHQENDQPGDHEDAKNEDWLREDEFDHTSFGFSDRVIMLVSPVTIAS